MFDERRDERRQRKKEKDEQILGIQVQYDAKHCYGEKGCPPSRGPSVFSYLSIIFPTSAPPPPIERTRRRKVDPRT